VQKPEMINEIIKL